MKESKYQQLAKQYKDLEAKSNYHLSMHLNPPLFRPIHKTKNPLHPRIKLKLKTHEDLRRTKKIKSKAPKQQQAAEAKATIYIELELEELELKEPTNKKPAEILRSSGKEWMPVAAKEENHQSL